MYIYLLYKTLALLKSHNEKFRALSYYLIVVWSGLVEADTLPYLVILSTTGMSLPIRLLPSWGIPPTPVSHLNFLSKFHVL
jgi:hypothetical protein